MISYEPTAELLPKKKRKTACVGIDCGVHTGMAVWIKEDKDFLTICTLSAHEAWKDVRALMLIFEVKVRFEDARLRKWFGASGREKLQGAGSVKRDSSLWQEFCELEGIPFEAVAPMNNRTKTTPELFKKLTKWEGRTSVHARDAAMLVLGL